METELATHPEVRALLQLALAEDLGAGDLTVEALIGPAQPMVARLVAREAGVLAGLALAEDILRLAGGGVTLTSVAADGQRLAAGQAIAELRGPARTILIAERTLLNFLQRLSGIATLTARYVDAVAATGARIYDTRKTAPGLRRLSKYAVRLGGGEGHRAGLFDQVLVKDTHLDALRAAGAGSDLTTFFADVVARCRGACDRRTPVEVEVRDLAEAEAALRAGADIVLLDNFDLAGLRAAVALRARLGLTRIALEASGGITLANVRPVAETGVERISVGALTHSAPALDLALDALPRADG